MGRIAMIKYPYKYSIINSVEITDRVEWCKTQFGKEYERWSWQWMEIDNYTSMHDTFYFKKEEDMLWFILRWS